MGGQKEQIKKKQNNQRVHFDDCCKMGINTIKSRRVIQELKMKGINQPVEVIKAVNECDTDLDTSCLGRNFVVYTNTYRNVEVYSYDKCVPPKIVPIVPGATSYDIKKTGETVILLFYKSLYYASYFGCFTDIYVSRTNLDNLGMSNLSRK